MKVSSHVPWLFALVALASCGGGGATTVDAGLDAQPDAARDLVPEMPRDVSPATAVAALDGLRWELPCSNNFNGYCMTPLAQVKTAMLTGTPGATYEIVLRFRGVVEEKTYEGGTADGPWIVGGAPAADLYNVYQLDIAQPPQTFFLNGGASNAGYCIAIDYTKTLRIAADSAVTLTADPIDDAQVENGGIDGMPVVVPGIPPAPARYDGQFVQMDVVSVALAP